MNVRESVRALITNRSKKILLSKVLPIDTTISNGLWVTIGGRITPGEHEVDALRREIKEELNVDVVPPFPEKVWTTDEVLNWNGNKTRVIEHFYWLLWEAGDPKFVGLSSHERATTLDLRWWSFEEMELSAECFSPPDLHDRVKQLLTQCRLTTAIIR